MAFGKSAGGMDKRGNKQPRGSAPGGKETPSGKKNARKKEEALATKDPRLQRLRDITDAFARDTLRRQGQERALTLDERATLLARMASDLSPDEQLSFGERLLSGGDIPNDIAQKLRRIADEHVNADFQAPEPTIAVQAVHAQPESNRMPTPVPSAGEGWTPAERQQEFLNVLHHAQHPDRKPDEVRTLQPLVDVARALGKVKSGKKEKSTQKGKEVSDTTPSPNVLTTLSKDPASWTALEMQQAIEELTRLKQDLGPYMDRLKVQTDTTLRNGEREENILLAEYAKLFAEATTVKNAPLNVKLEKFAYFSQRLITLGLSGASLEEKHLGKTSQQTSAVAELVAGVQRELEKTGNPIPQPVTMDPLSFQKKDILDLGHRLASGGISVSVLALEVGTIATMILLLAQELFGLFITPWSKAHVAIIGAVTLVLGPVIEHAKGVYFTKPAERKERKKSKQSYPERLQASVAKNIRAGALALIAGTTVAGASKAIQGATLEVGVAMGEQSADLGEQAAQGIEQTTTFRAAFSESGPAWQQMDAVGTVTDSMLDVEYSGGNVPGQGGSREEGIGPALAYKAALLLGAWRTDRWGELPATGSARDAFNRGLAARAELGLDLATEGGGTVHLTLEEALKSLHAEFRLVAPETAEGAEPAMSTQDHLDALGEAMDLLGVRVGQIPDRGRLDELKFRLAISDIWPGAPVIYKIRDEALAHVEIIQERERAFQARANALVDGVSRALNEEATRMNRQEGPISITFANTAFDTTLLRSIHVENSVSIREMPEAHVQAAEALTHGTGWLNILATGFLLYGAASFGVAGIAYGKGRMNRKRYMDFIERFRKDYPLTTENKTGYLDQLSAGMTKGIQALFASEVGFFGREAMRDLTEELGGQQWVRIDEESLQIAISEVMGELKEVDAMDAMDAFEGITHMYAHGLKDIVSRGNPEELKALNAAHRLLNNQSEFAQKLIEKLFPGFFRLEAFMEQRSKDAKPANLSKEEAMEFDARLYGVILGHLERRVKIEKTKLAWCKDAFNRFRKNKTFEHLGIGILAEEPNEANIPLKSCEGFSSTPLKAEKLAGTALRQAAIRTLKGKMDNAQSQLREVDELLIKMNSSLTKKAPRLGAVDSSIYGRIDALRAQVPNAEAFEEHADESIAQLTPEGKINSIMTDVSVAEIASRMGVSALDIESKESPEELRARIETQFNTLIRVAKTKWSWDKIAEKDLKRSLLRDSISNGQYDMGAEFLVIPADDTTPTASYNVQFTINSRPQEATAIPEEVVKISYSLSASFSEKKTPAQILDYFREHIDERGQYYAARVFAHRIRTALAKEKQYDVARTQAPIELTGQRAGEQLTDYYNGYLKHDSIQRHRDSLFGRLNARASRIPESPDAKPTGQQLAANASDEWETINKDLKMLCEEVESYQHPSTTPPISSEQMNDILRSLEQSEDVRKRRIRIVYDHAQGKVMVERRGFIGTGLGKKVAEVPISSFKTTFENQGGAIDRTIRILLEERRAR